MAGSTDVDAHRVWPGSCQMTHSYNTDHRLLLLVAFPLAVIGNNFMLCMHMYVWEPYTYVACLSLA